MNKIIMSDRVAIRGKYNGVEFVVFRRRCGYDKWTCGYVAIDKPVDYMDLPIQCHGDLTYGSWGIPTCRNKSANYRQSQFFIGFDTNHGFETCKQRSMHYAVGQCKKIIDQLGYARLVLSTFYPKVEG